MSTTDLSVRVGANIKQARKVAGLTQGQLAERIGMTSLMAVSRWERGEHKPSDESLIALSIVLKRDLAWFYTDHEQAERAA